MALFGDVGKFFQAAVAPIVAPTKGLVDLARGKNTQEVISQGRRDLGIYTGAGRAVLGLVGIGGSSNRVDQPAGPPMSGAPAQDYGYNPTQYFQPSPFSGGSYDPNIGGGAVSWDSGTSWDWAEPSQIQPAGYSTIWD